MHWIKDYAPKNDQEAEDRSHLLRLDPALIATDRAAPYHYTTSSMVMDFDTDKLLMVYHPIYKSFSWPGGHVEEGEELFYSALRELYEETGILYVKPLAKAPLAMELMSVKAHVRKGEAVDSHFHINFCYGFIGHEDDTLLDVNENRLWVPVRELDTFVSEDHMLPIYKDLIGRMKHEHTK
ncbi:MAG: NUDIX domain-containing protein [Peptoniphilus sp.]|nr:NUDIX domain-containing protein [Peptoniphilus sp.]MDY3118321.1 NUDIX domain-containing protein [Peptoniphilus sp.]